jgi:hypothetical protein
MTLALRRRRVGQEPPAEVEAKLEELRVVPDVIAARTDGSSQRCE